MEGLRRAALAALLVSTAAHAAQDVAWYSQIDNDVAFHTDRWYTSGVRLGRVQRLDADRYLELGVLQEIYTPDPHRVAPGTIDRPYVGRLFVTLARHDLLPGIFRTLELDAGVRGPAALGRQSAEAIHQLIPAPDYDWSRQLPNRFDAQAIAVQTHELPHAALHYGVVAGNQVSLAHAGGEVRVGVPTMALQPLRFAATPLLGRDGAPGWSGFAGASARWVLRNALLSQNANAIGPPIERRKGVVRVAAGLAWSAPWGAVTLAAVQDSREFETQHSPHRFGVLGVRLDFL